MSIKKYSSGQWVDVPYRKYETATDTITTLPKTIITDGQSASAVIKGNLSQSGTPTPASPIYPQETGDKTANLFDKSTMSSGYYAITTGIRENSNYYCSDFIPITAATYYFQNVVGSSNQNSVVVYDVNKQGLRYEKIIGRDKASGTLTFIEGDAYIRINCSATTDVDTVMVSLGSTALPYEPYGYKIPILSANTTTPVYLGQVESERKIYRYAFTGQEADWRRTGTGRMGCVLPTISLKDGNYPCVCSHYKGVGISSIGSINDGECTTNTTDNEYIVYDTNYSTIADFKTYLQQQYSAGTPVCVWYVLATPTTGVVNEPIRKIGDYADSVSVTGIPTTGTAESFDIDTTLKPSEVQLTYHGWHEHSDTKFSED